MLVEKFLIKEKEPSRTLSANTDEKLGLTAAVQRRVTRRMTRRRSSADITMDPEQLQREIAIAQVQAEVLDNLVAEEQAEIELGHVVPKRNMIDELNNVKKVKRKKKRSSSCSSSSEVDDQIKSENDDVAQVIGIADEDVTISESTQVLRESIHLPAPRRLQPNESPNNVDKVIEEQVLVLPVKKKYFKDTARNSAYLTLKKPPKQNTIGNDATSEAEAPAKDTETRVKSIQDTLAVSDTHDTTCPPIVVLVESNKDAENLNESKDEVASSQRLLNKKSLVQSSKKSNNSGLLVVAAAAPPPPASAPEATVKSKVKETSKPKVENNREQPVKQTAVEVTKVESISAKETNEPNVEQVSNELTCAKVSEEKVDKPVVSKKVEQKEVGETLEQSNKEKKTPKIRKPFTKKVLGKIIIENPIFEESTETETPKSPKKLDHLFEKCDVTSARKEEGNKDTAEEPKKKKKPLIKKKSEEEKLLATLNEQKDGAVLWPRSPVDDDVSQSLQIGVTQDDESPIDQAIGSVTLERAGDQVIDDNANKAVDKQSSAKVLEKKKKLQQQRVKRSKATATGDMISKLSTNKIATAKLAEEVVEKKKSATDTEIDFWSEIKTRDTVKAVEPELHSLQSSPLEEEAKAMVRQENDTDGPLTPTETRSFSNLAKWTNRDNLTQLTDPEDQKPKDEEMTTTPVDSANNTVTTKKKKKIVKKKKSTVKTTKKKSKEKIEDSAKNVTAPTQRPQDLLKMFYTTPYQLLTATPRDLRKVRRNKVKKKKSPSCSSDSTGSTSTTSTDDAGNSTCEDEADPKRNTSTRSNDSGFDGSPRLLSK